MLCPAFATSLRQFQQQYDGDESFGQNAPNGDVGLEVFESHEPGEPRFDVDLQRNFYAYTWAAGREAPSAPLA